MLEDDELDDGKSMIRKERKKTGDKLEEKNYPKVDEKEGFYVSWDAKSVDSVDSDQIITATYQRYRTTLAEDPKDHRQETHIQCSP